MKHIHSVSILDGSTLAAQDRLLVAVKPDVPNVAGGGAGAAVVTHVTFSAGQLPAKYAVEVTPNQACMPSVSNKTNSGFDVTLTPLPAATVSAGTFDVTVKA